MAFTAPLRRHRIRWICVFGFVLLLVASLGAASEEFLDLKARAEKGDADAQNKLGLMYANGQGVAQDIAAALKWWRLAAEQGDAKAQYNLGVMYYNGQGVAQDYTEALRWYHKAAEQGDAKAQYNLGVMYYSGQGITQDYAEAVKWLRMAEK